MRRIIRKALRDDLPLCVIIATALSMTLMVCIFLSLPVKDVRTPKLRSSRERIVQRKQPVMSDTERGFLRSTAYAEKMMRIACGKTTEAECFSIYNSVIDHSRLQGIDDSIVFAMIAQESNFIIDADSKAGASYGRGLMQVSTVSLKDFNWRTGKDYSTDDMYTVDRNIEVGCWIYNQNRIYLKSLAPLTDHELVIAYNCGIGTFSRERYYLLDGKRKSGERYRHLIRFQEYLKVFEELKEEFRLD